MIANGVDAGHIRYINGEPYTDDISALPFRITFCGGNSHLIRTETENLYKS